ncbi:MAG: TrkH family potassium uptake protein [Myxococcales bacterium]|nr:TrkH family potassium uptake protein [Myxococcales bacterium]
MKRFILTPVRALVLSFAGAIAVGAVLLWLPPATVAPGHLGFVDALFTATSATTVTGLVVVDTGTVFTRFGQCVILGLIQLGGLGIMTFSTILLLLVGKRVSFRDRVAVQSAFTHAQIPSMAALLRWVVLATLAAEGLGALLLWVGFRGEPHRAFSALFHAVSAFCNAGFALYPDSLTRWRSDPVINLTVTTLIIAGGTGFLVFRDTVLVMTGRRRRLSLNTKICWITYMALLAGGVLFFGVLERNNSLRGLPLGEKALATWFQVVTLRTAGFNTLDFSTFANATLFFSIIYMFIGASPGSCAGGIKTSTFAVLVAAARSRLSGHLRVSIFQRSVPDATVTRALAIVLASFVVINGAALALMIVQTGSHSHAATRGLFLELLFEVTSAFGTVGLSTGVTPTLSPIGKLIIISVMFAGRLGPITLALATTAGRERRFTYAQENVMVG